MILKNGIDQVALVNKFADATARQGETICKTVREALEQGGTAKR